MYNKNFFKKLCHLNTSFVLMLIYHIFDGYSMAIDQKDNEICGLAENQIQESLSHPNKYLMRGIAINPRCLESENVNSECLTEQNKLIECLQKQYMLAKEQENEENELSYNLKDIKSKCQESEKYSLQNIIEGNEQLNCAVKDHKEIIIKHLQSIGTLKKKVIFADDLKITLVKAKFELTTALQRQMLDAYASKMKTLGVYHKECLEKEIQNAIDL